jgi:hypothetical protein
VYGAGARVTVDISQSGFSLWASGASYAEGDLVIQNEIGYICTTDNTDLTFTTANWAAVAPRYTIYHGAYPTACTLNGQSNPPTLTNPYAPVFDYKNAYSKNDVVLWKGFTYVCAQDSTQITHQQALQYAQYSKLPFGNVFPDDPIANANGQYWNTKTAYVIPRGTPLSDPLWVKGDNRNQTIVDAMVTITVFKLSPTLAPMNRPAGWLEDYRCTLNDLNEIALGRMSIMLPVKQPAQGLKTSFGGEVKQRNNY